MMDTAHHSDRMEHTTTTEKNTQSTRWNGLWRKNAITQKCGGSICTIRAPPMRRKSRQTHTHTSIRMIAHKTPSRISSVTCGDLAKNGKIPLWRSCLELCARVYCVFVILLLIRMLFGKPEIETERSTFWTNYSDDFRSILRMKFRYAGSIKTQLIRLRLTMCRAVRANQEVTSTNCIDSIHGNPQ